MLAPLITSIAVTRDQSVSFTVQPQPMQASPDGSDGWLTEMKAPCASTWSKSFASVGSRGEPSWKSRKPVLPMTLACPLKVVISVPGMSSGAGNTGCSILISVSWVMVLWSVTATKSRLASRAAMDVESVGHGPRSPSGPHEPSECAVWVWKSPRRHLLASACGVVAALRTPKLAAGRSDALLKLTVAM